MNHLSNKTIRLDETIKEITRDIRDKFSAENLSDLNIQIKISGRTDGDLKISYQVSEEYGSNSVKANDLYDATMEYIRRHGFAKTHAPTLLPNA